MADYDGFVVHRWEFDSPREHQFMLSIGLHPVLFGGHRTT